MIAWHFVGSGERTYSHGMDDEIGDCDRCGGTGATEGAAPAAPRDDAWLAEAEALIRAHGSACFDMGATRNPEFMATGAQRASDTEAALLAHLRAAPAAPLDDAVERALEQTWRMIDPFNPPPAGSYSRGVDEGICSALKTFRENYERELRARPAAPLPDEDDPVAWMQIGVGPLHEGERVPRLHKPKEWNPEWWRFEPLYARSALSAPAAAPLPGELPDENAAFCAWWESVHRHIVFNRTDAWCGWEARAALYAAQPAQPDRDAERLDFLDRCNAALNAHYGTSYGWKLIINRNVVRLLAGRAHRDIDLHDSEGSSAKLPSCREAIDAAMKAAQPAQEPKP